MDWTAAMKLKIEIYIFRLSIRSSSDISSKNVQMFSASNRSTAEVLLPHFLSMQIFHSFPSSKFNFDLFLTMSSRLNVSVIATNTLNLHENFASTCENVCSRNEL